MFLKNIGPTELLILLLILILVFGGSRIGELGGALGRSIRDFRREVRSTEDEPDGEEEPEEAEKTSAA